MHACMYVCMCAFKYVCLINLSALLVDCLMFVVTLVTLLSTEEVGVPNLIFTTSLPGTYIQERDRDRQDNESRPGHPLKLMAEPCLQTGLQIRNGEVWPSKGCQQPSSSATVCTNRS